MLRSPPPTATRFPFLLISSKIQNRRPVMDFKFYCCSFTVSKKRNLHIYEKLQIFMKTVPRRVNSHITFKFTMTKEFEGVPCDILLSKKTLNLICSSFFLASDWCKSCTFFILNTNACTLFNKKIKIISLCLIHKLGIYRLLSYICRLATIDINVIIIPLKPMPWA